MFRRGKAVTQRRDITFSDTMYLPTSVPIVTTHLCLHDDGDDVIVCPSVCADNALFERVDLLAMSTNQTTDQRARQSVRAV